LKCSTVEKNNFEKIITDRNGLIKKMAKKIVKKVAKKKPAAKKNKKK